MMSFDDETQRALTYVGTAFLAFAGAIWKMRLWARRDVREDSMAEAESKFKRTTADAHADLVDALRDEVERLGRVVTEQGLLIHSLQSDLYKEREARWEQVQKGVELQRRISELEGQINGKSGAQA